jgi:hypothetical protein
LENDMCPVARSLEAVGDRWSMLVVRDAVAGERRFGEFVESPEVARNILRTAGAVAAGLRGAPERTPGRCTGRRR